MLCTLGQWVVWQPRSPRLTEPYYFIMGCRTTCPTCPCSEENMTFVMCMHAKSLQSCPTLCNFMDCIARQTPLTMGFSWQGYWSGLPCPPPGDLPDPGIESASLMSLALAGRSFTTSATWEAPTFNILEHKQTCLLLWSKILLTFKAVHYRNILGKVTFPWSDKGHQCLYSYEIPKLRIVSEQYCE